MEWLPNIKRDNYRFGSFYTTLARGELGPALQEMEKYEHVGNLFSSVYDRGAKILNMIEARLGEERFIEFIRYLYGKYYFKVLLAKDFQAELEKPSPARTGLSSSPSGSTPTTSPTGRSRRSRLQGGGHRSPARWRS